MAQAAPLRPMTRVHHPGRPVPEIPVNLPGAPFSLRARIVRTPDTFHRFATRGTSPRRSSGTTTTTSRRGAFPSSLIQLFRGVAGGYRVFGSGRDRTALSGRSLDENAIRRDGLFAPGKKKP